MRIGFIGLGGMGQGMAANLLKERHDDPTERLERLMTLLN